MLGHEKFNFESDPKFKIFTEVISVRSQEEGPSELIRDCAPTELDLMTPLIHLIGVFDLIDLEPPMLGEIAIFQINQHGIGLSRDFLERNEFNHFDGIATNKFPLYHEGRDRWVDEIIKKNKEYCDCKEPQMQFNDEYPYSFQQRIFLFYNRCLFIHHS